MRRASAVAAATFLAVAGLAVPTSAAALPVCGPTSGSGNIPGETCEPGVTAVAECVGEDLVLEYAVTNRDSAETTVDITWQTPSGAVTTPDQPLTGSLPWPEGVTTDLDVTFATTPPVTVPARYLDCEEGGVAAAPPSRSTTRGAVTAQAGGVLATTGSTVAPLAIGGGALVAAGAALVLVRRARRDGV